MKVVETILRNASSVTDLLSDGASGVRTMRERQGQTVPYIVVTQNLVDPNDTQDGQPLREWEVNVNIVSNALDESDGSYNIGEEVKSVLHDASGTYDSELVAKIVFNDQSQQLFSNTNEVRVQVQQTYRMYIRGSIAETDNVPALLLSQAEYDALGTYDSSTYYIIEA